MFIYNSEVIARDCEPGVSRKVLAYSEEMMMCEISFKKGAIGLSHSHPHLQVTYIVQGSFEFTIENETKIVKVGDSLLMPAGSMHGTVALEENSRVIDVFHPMRAEFL